MRLIDADNYKDVLYAGNWDEQYREARNMAFAALMEPGKLESNLKVLESSDWISVEERLPKPYVSVLVYMPEERPLPTVHEGFLAREGVWYANHFDRDPGDVTHWMPMPEPPKEVVGNA